MSPVRRASCCDQVLSIDRLHERLRRRTSSTRYIAEIDGLRFVCISMVVAFHLFVIWQTETTEIEIIPPFGDPTAPVTAPNPALQLIQGGQHGVEIFFAISGFVLALPFLMQRLAEGPHVSVRRYFLRRLTRLEPPYLAALVLWLIVGASLWDTHPPLAARFAAGAFYLHGPVMNELNPILGVAWSLEIEVQFYLLVPLFARVLTKPPSALGRRLGAVVLGAAGFLTAYWFDPYESPALVLGYLPFFMAGWLVADLYTTAWKARTVGTLPWDVLGLFGWVSCLVLFGFGTERDILAFGAIPVGFILAGVLRGTWLRRILSLRWIVIIGGAAYSIYLIHYPLVVLWGHLFGAPAGPFAFVRAVSAILAAILFAGLLFFALVERPCMDPGWPSRAISLLRDRGHASSQASVAELQTDAPIPVGVSAGALDRRGPGR